jgi:hypothetical protein
MRRLALAVLAVLLAALPSRLAQAQRYFAFTLPIAPEGETLGAIHEAPVTLVRWTGAEEALFRYEDAELRLETPARFASGELQARVVVGVGRASVVRSGPWQIRMAAGAWAPVRGQDAGAPRITLPHGMPTTEGVLAARGAAPGRPEGPFAHAAVPTRGLDMACAGQLTLRAGPEADAPRWVVPEGALHRVSGRRAPFRVEVHIEGFVVTGYVDAPQSECLAAMGASGVGVGCGDGVMHGLAVRVPRGTPLYASSASTTPFAWVRREIVAREQLDTPRAQLCTSVDGAPLACRPEPPMPTGTQTLFFDREPDDHGDWSFAAEVRVPFETLTVAQGVSGGVGGCFASRDWPE